MIATNAASAIKSKARYAPIRTMAGPGNWYAIARFAQIAESTRATANALVPTILKPLRINSDHLTISTIGIRSGFGVECQRPPPITIPEEEEKTRGQLGTAFSTFRRTRGQGGHFLGSAFLTHGQLARAGISALAAPIREPPRRQQWLRCRENLQTAHSRPISPSRKVFFIPKLAER